MMPGKRELPSAERRGDSAHPLSSLFVKEVIMANKSLFASLKSRLVRADTVNEAGGRAYTLAAEARPGAACGYRLLQRHLLRRRPMSNLPR